MIKSDFYYLFTLLWIRRWKSELKSNDNQEGVIFIKHIVRVVGGGKLAVSFNGRLIHIQQVPIQQSKYQERSLPHVKQATQRLISMSCFSSAVSFWSDVRENLCSNPGLFYH